MFKSVDENFLDSDVSIFAAAVSDYTPKSVSENKIKKKDETLSISLNKTRDILKEMGAKKKDSQFVVGFALETENEIENAQSKLKRKNADMIALNSLNNTGAGFKYDTNKISIIDENNITDFELKDKSEVAADIVAKIIELN
jgi:phosphopantothenoylcysteine decarboxylase/phosphopantothenate--cysteine ligase